MSGKGLLMKNICPLLLTRQEYNYLTNVISQRQLVELENLREKTQCRAWERETVELERDFVELFIFLEDLL